MLDLELLDREPGRFGIENKRFLESSGRVYGSTILLRTA